VCAARSSPHRPPPLCVAPALTRVPAPLPARQQGDIDTSAREADEAGGLAALQWVPGPELQGKGLSSGVKKVNMVGCLADVAAGSSQQPAASREKGRERATAAWPHDTCAPEAAQI
jgi:hypothetical protein